MKRVLLAMVVALILAGCGERGSIGGLLVMEGRHTIDDGTTLAGDLFVLDGHVSLRPGGRITGSAFVLGGDVVIGGAVDGDIAVVGGRLRLTDEATVAGGLRRGGGHVEQADEATVGTELVSPVAVDALIGLTRPAVEAEADGFSAWLVVQLAMLALLAAAAARVARRGIERMVEAIHTQPLVPLAVGTLGLIVGLSLLVFMVFTVVLIPVAVLLALAAVLGSALGLVSLSVLAVRRTLGPSMFGGRVSIQAAAGSVALAVAVLMISRIPLVGEVTVAAVAATALGVWLSTRFATRGMPVEQR
jgi:hypothetical protein